MADCQDPAFPSHLSDELIVRPLQTVVRSIASHTKHRPDAILLSGDLTSRGDINGYAHCLDFLLSALNLSNWKTESLHVVPGNHDVDRTAIETGTPDLNQKFEPIRQAWVSRDLPILAASELRQSIIKYNTASVSLYSINSSVGCGEKRYLPAKIADDLHSLLNDFAANANAEHAFELLGETLDTPGFRQNDIETLCSTIREDDDKTLPILLSHHNLLPQAVLRISLYGEVLNAGLVRSRLCKLGRPLLYCHGHIHDDPIEVISSPDNKTSKLICISAPLITSGYNLLQIAYGTKGYALGISVHRYKLSTRDGDISTEATRIPLHAPGYSRALKLGDTRLATLLAILPKTELRFLEVLNKCKTVWNHFKQQDLAQLLMEGEWLSLVEIQDLQDAVEFWRITKVIR